jgi:hypothetical protein
MLNALSFPVDARVVAILPIAGFYLSIDIYYLNRQAEEHMDFPR